MSLCLFWLNKCIDRAAISHLSVDAWCMQAQMPKVNLVHRLWIHVRPATWDLHFSFKHHHVLRPLSLCTNKLNRPYSLTHSSKLLSCWNSTILDAYCMDFFTVIPYLMLCSSCGTCLCAHKSVTISILHFLKLGIEAYNNIFLPFC